MLRKCGDKVDLQKNNISQFNGGNKLARGLRAQIMQGMGKVETRDLSFFT